MECEAWLEGQIMTWKLLSALTFNDIKEVCQYNAPSSQGNTLMMKTHM